jgi:hypothetical protein
MSFESDFAWRAARFYGPVRAQLSRTERIAFVRALIALLESQMREEHAAHKASCPDCQRSNMFCLGALSITPADSVRLNRLRFLRALSHSEEQDAAYAQRARLQPVDYKQHVDGFCRYWQNVRHRKFAAVGWKCERCGRDGPLDAHHLHYDTLGSEELCDLQALCRDCHERADRARAASARYSNAMDTYMRKKYGDDYEWSEAAEDEFDQWLEQKQEEEW